MVWFVAIVPLLVGLLLFYVDRSLKLHQLLTQANQELEKASDTSDDLAERLWEARQLIAVAAHAPKPMNDLIRQRMEQYLDHYEIQTSVEIAPAYHSNRVH